MRLRKRTWASSSYGFTLDIERAPNVVALQGVTPCLVAEVDAERGEPAVRSALGL